MKKIVILGGGFGGLEAARAARKYSSYDITLIDHSSKMTFHGHLHQIVSERIKPEEIEIDLETSLNKINVHFLQANVLGIKKGLVVTSKGDLEFDSLIIAMGSKTCFSVKGTKNCDELKQTKHAIEIHDHLLNLRRNKVVVVGAGLTGTELVFEINELGKKYNKHFNIHLVEASNNPIPNFPKKAQNIVKNKLYQEKITCHFGKKIMICNPHQLILENSIFLDYDLLIWTAGIEPVANAKTYGLESTNGFVKVNKHLMTSAKGVFAIGDIAWFDIGMGHELWTAVSAINEGKTAGKNAVNFLEGKNLQEYKPDKKHTFLISLGKKSGLYVKGKIVKHGKIPLIMKRQFMKNYIKSRR